MAVNCGQTRDWVVFECPRKINLSSTVRRLIKMDADSYVGYASYNTRPGVRNIDGLSIAPELFQCLQDVLREIGLGLREDVANGNVDRLAETVDISVFQVDSKLIGLWPPGWDLAAAASGNSGHESG